MIIGRTNTVPELNEQMYMVHRIQPILNKIVLELMKKKPEHPVPDMIDTLDEITKQQTDPFYCCDDDHAQNEPLGEEELRHYWALTEEKKQLQKEIDVI